jgi:hypothetical protein
MYTHLMPACRVLGILLVALFGTSLEAAPPASGPLVLENLTLRLVLQANSTVSSLVLKPDREMVQRAPARVLMRLETDTGWHASSSLTWERVGDAYRLRVGFQNTPLAGIVVLRPHADYFEFETVGLEGPGQERVRRWIYASVFSAVKGNTGSWLNVAWDDDAALALLALDERTEARGASILQATALARLGFAGRKAALVATATPALLDLVRRIEQQHGLPSPTVGGQWAKTAAETRRSWMISGLSAAAKPADYAPERVFRVAEQLGVRTVVIALGWWNSSFGSYTLNARNFPGGVESLRAVARQAHARGLRLGLHVMTRSVTKNDPLVTPKPDPRLSTEGELTLAANLDASARELTTRESPQSFGAAEGYWAHGGMDVWIDDEIIHYGGLREQPYGLVDCRRGAYGTKAAAHGAGAKVRHITERYGWYVAGAELGAEIGRRLAELINAAELDAICFDGADVQADSVVNFYEGHQVAQGVYRHARRDVLLFSNGTTHFGWHLMARGGEEDAMARGYQGWVDYRIVAEWAGWHLKNFMPPDLAWVGIFGTTPTMTACRPDDIEMVCARSVGIDASIGWGLAACYGGPSSVVEWERNGRREEIGQVARAYEKVRAEHLLSPGLRQPMSELGSHWRLLPPDAAHPQWRRVPVDYRKSPIFAGPQSEPWRTANRFSAQPLRVRIEALSAVAAYGSPDNKVLVDFARDKFTRGGDPFVAVTWERTNESHPQASAVLRIRGEDPKPGSRYPQKLTGHGSPAWAEATVELPAVVDLRAHRALGLWIHGDGGGEVLNVQLAVDRQSHLHYYQPIDFRGWRYCELGEPEGDRVMEYFEYEKFALHELPLNRIRSVTLMILEPPADKPVELRIGRIEALAERGGRVDQPRVRVGDQELRLPAVLEPGQYLETGDLWGTRDPQVCRVFDDRGNQLARLRLENVPTVPPGPTPLGVAWGGQPAARAKVTAILLGGN